MVNRTEAHSVRDHGISPFRDVRQDVCRIEQALLPERTDSALLLVCRQDEPPESRLMNTHTCLSEQVLTLDRVVDLCRSWIVGDIQNCARGDVHLSFDWIVDVDEPWKQGLVVARSGCLEIHDGRLELMGGYQRPVVRLIYGAGSVAIDPPVSCGTVAIRRPKRCVERECGGAALLPGSKEPFVLRHEGKGALGKREGAIEGSPVW